MGDLYLLRQLPGANVLCHVVQAYALEHILLGDELAARAALLQKASVADALVQATRRAEANSALARYVAPQRPLLT